MVSDQRKVSVYLSIPAGTAGVVTLNSDPLTSDPLAGKVGTSSALSIKEESVVKVLATGGVPDVRPHRSEYVAL